MELLLNNIDDLSCLLSLISLNYIKSLTKSNKNIVDLIPGAWTTYILQ